MRNMVKSLVSLKSDLVKLSSDEEGAALIEYTVLLGIMLVAVIAIIAGVGGWITNQWTKLGANLNAHP